MAFYYAILISALHDSRFYCILTSGGILAGALINLLLV